MYYAWPKIRPPRRQTGRLSADVLVGAHLSIPREFGAEGSEAEWVAAL